MSMQQVGYAPWFSTDAAADAANIAFPKCCNSGISLLVGASALKLRHSGADYAKGSSC